MPDDINNMQQQTQPGTVDGAGGAQEVPATPADEAKTYNEDYVTQLKAELAAQRDADVVKAVDEALKKAKMSNDDRAAYEQEQKAKALDDREKALGLRELRADTVKLLAEKSLPAGIIDLVLADDQENTGKRIEAFKTVFDKAVQDEVTKRLAGKTPPAGSAGQQTGSSGFFSAIIENQAKRG